jgi:hypothetical protein
MTNFGTKVSPVIVASQGGRVNVVAVVERGQVLGDAVVEVPVGLCATETNGGAHLDLVLTL